MAIDPKADGYDPQGLQTPQQQELWKRWDELVAKASKGGVNLAEVDEIIRLRDALGLSEKRPLF